MTASLSLLQFSLRLSYSDDRSRRYPIENPIFVTWDVCCMIPLGSFKRHGERFVQDLRTENFCLL